MNNLTTYTRFIILQADLALKIKAILLTNQQSQLSLGGFFYAIVTGNDSTPLGRDN
jgi:hypothetical protein